MQIIHTEDHLTLIVVRDKDGIRLDIENSIGETLLVVGMTEHEAAALSAALNEVTERAKL